MYSLVRDLRNKRNTTMFDPSQYSIENYCIDMHQKKEMKHSFGEELLNNLHLLPDPLKKNLADSIVTSDEPKQRMNKNLLNMETVQNQYPQMQKPSHQSDQGSPQPFSGISSFFSGVMNVISSAMFQWRPRSPATYYDCFDESNVSRQGSPPCWQDAKTEDQNKNERAHDLISIANAGLQSDMSEDVKSAAAQCEDKLKKVRLLLTSKPVETPKFRSRRPRKVFVEPGSVEESYEDAFAPEDFVSLSNDSYVEYCGPFQYHKQELLQTDSPKMRTHLAPVNETTEIVATLPEVEKTHSFNCTAVNNQTSNGISVNGDTFCKIVNNCDNKEESKENQSEITHNRPDPTKMDAIALENTKEVLISSCEDKVSKLKALLQERRKNNTKTITTSTDSPVESEEMTNDMARKPPIPVPNEKSQDKRFKNPCRRTDKRRKSKLKKHIQDDMMFAHEINSEDLSSVENSPSLGPNCLTKRLVGKVTHRIYKLPCSLSPSSAKSPSATPSLPSTEYFDEISGRFHSASTDSDDSFQIVFNDSPKTRPRIPSDCDSEDSFIVFEDSPNSCYTSKDVFGEESDSDCDYSDSESEVSDSGIPVTKLSHSLSRTFGDLTDDSLFEDKCEDEVDCAVRLCEEIPCEDIVIESEEVCDVKSTGVLLDEAKKLLRKSQPPKKVHFSPHPPKVHVMRVWAFAARQARAGHWERCALDRDRFKRRIADVDMAVSWVLKPQHRRRVMFQRFMPWWHAQRRQELAEKKKKEEEDRIRAEAERLLEEERLRAEAERELKEQRKLEEQKRQQEKDRQTAFEAFKKIRKIKRIGRTKVQNTVNNFNKNLTNGHNGINEQKPGKINLNDNHNDKPSNDCKDKLPEEVKCNDDKIKKSLCNAEAGQDIEKINNKLNEIKLGIQETLSGT